MYFSRTVLIALAIKYNGDWDKILESAQHYKEPEKQYIDMALNMKCKAITLMDDKYPLQLKQIFKPPFVLFYYGDIDLIKDYGRCISIVGSRDYSEYGEIATREIVSGVTNEGYITVSGMAIGIDSIAQETCIACGGKTVAVLGGGIDNCYPPSSMYLYKEIKKNHLVLSEYFGDSNPQPENFLIRNRIIAGLSKTLIVTEAKGHSGTLVTATLALQGNTDVMCVPYPINQDSKCNELIRAGAILVENSSDVLKSMRPF